MTERFLPVDASGMRVVVTAAGAGIGRTIAEAFNARGARVHICDIDGAALDQALSECPGLLGTTADVSRSDQVDALFEEVARKLGGLDVQFPAQADCDPGSPAWILYQSPAACGSPDCRLGCARAAMSASHRR